MKYFSIDYWLDKVLLLSFLLNEQSKNGYCFVSGNEIKNSLMSGAIENTNPVLFNLILSKSEVTSDPVLNRIKRSYIFTAQQISWFRKNQIQAFTEWQIPWFRKTQIQAFTEQQIPWFRKNQIQALTAEQIPWFTKKQIKAFTAEQVGWFTCKQLQVLTNIQIESFTTEQTSAFTAEQMQCFSEEQRKRLASDQTQELPTADINKIEFQNEFSISKNNSSLSNV